MPSLVLPRGAGIPDSSASCAGWEFAAGLFLATAFSTGFFAAAVFLAGSFVAGSFLATAFFAGAVVAVCFVAGFFVTAIAVLDLPGSDLTGGLYRRRRGELRARCHVFPS